uniref:Uncharacterized protein n=1 Tax=Arundo donax TaxID=35708 RepID=A0A0A8Z987_ARUDO
MELQQCGVYKTGLPRLEGGLSISEDDGIPLFPDFPGCNRKDFREERVVTLPFSLLDCVKEI